MGMLRVMRVSRATSSTPKSMLPGKAMTSSKVNPAHGKRSKMGKKSEWRLEAAAVTAVSESAAAGVDQTTDRPTDRLFLTHGPHESYGSSTGCTNIFLLFISGRIGRMADGHNDHENSGSSTTFHRIFSIGSKTDQLTEWPTNKQTTKIMGVPQKY